MHSTDNNNDSNKAVKSSITHWQMVAFSAPSIGLVFLVGPINIVQGIYAKYFGVPLTTLAAILLLCKLFDAFSDPLLGIISDRYRVRTGTRKPFVLIGSLALIVSSYFLFIPPDNVSTAYVTFWMLAFYAASTVKQLPTFAWASEMTMDPVERTRLFSVLTFIGRIGGVLFYLVPFLPLFTTTAMTPEVLKVSVMVGAVLILPGVYVALRYAPNGPYLPQEKAVKKKSALVSFKEAVSVFKRNKPFQIFVGAYMCIGLGGGMYYGMFFIFVDSYLGQGEAYAKLTLVGIVGALILMPLVYKVILRIGKKKTWILTSLATISAILYTGQLRPEEDVFVSLVVLQIILLFSTVSLPIITMPLLSETIDYGLLSDKTERRGLYFSVYSLLLKFEAALGMALGLAIAGWLGFDATATTHDEASGFAIRMAMVWVPCVFTSMGFFFIWKIPLNERRAGIIARRLEGRALREAEQRDSLALSPAL